LRFKASSCLVGWCAILHEAYWMLVKTEFRRLIRK
jgi:hypothetical protein